MASEGNDRIRVSVVPHTHWDREWYRPFQLFRMRLVDLLDRLLPQLEADPAYEHFLLDGQMAVVDDYLAVRPEAADTIRRLASAGRLSVGPWYILMDEFLVSGETIVRNLQLGLDRATSFGGAMQVGYLPDMFGHVAQMPQLLAQFGFEHAVVWRGVPAAVDREAFRWEALDGSSVRAEYLALGYSNGALVPDDAKDLLARIEGFASDQGPLVGDPILWMNGTDHLMPQPWLGRVVAEANSISEDHHLVITSLVEHLQVAASRDQAGLPHWRGELRSGARANLLMGVNSNRVDVRQAAARAELALERIAEPLCALFATGEPWPRALLDEAWLHMIRNSAHDSICACSVDEVGRAVLHRFDESLGIAKGLTDRALRSVATSAGGDLPLIVNPSARRRSGVVELTLPGEDDLAGTQVLEVLPARQVMGATIRSRAEEMVRRELEADPYVHRVEVAELTDGALHVTLFADAATPNPVLPGPVVAELRALADEAPAATVEVTKVRMASQRVLARTGEVGGFGWKRWRAAPLDVDPVVADSSALTLANGCVEVQVDPADGTWSVDGLGGFGRLVDDGDAGDTYNYCPPEQDLVVDRPEAVAVDVVESGPLRGRIEVRSTYSWPEGVRDGARSGRREVVVTTTLELRAGEDLVRAHHRLDNPSRDHRLRVWFPLPEPADRSIAECAFATVERGLTAEGGPSETGLPTFPSRRFVVAGGLTVAHEGLLEYELVDVRDGRAHALALTLLRCTELVSQRPMATRSLPAGPTDVLTEAAQMLGPQQLRYAVHSGGRDPYAVVDDAQLALLVARPRGGDPAGEEGGALSLEGAEVSALTRANRRLEVRVFNPTPAPTTVSIEGRQGWLVDLRGRTVGSFEGSFELRPWGIATAVLD
jgi:alpha-mannosidase